MARHGTARHGMAWHGTAGHGMAWHGSGAERAWAGRCQSEVGRDFSQPVVGAVLQLRLHGRLSVRLFVVFFISLSAFPFTIRNAGSVGCRWGTLGNFHICSTNPQIVTISSRNAGGGMYMEVTGSVALIVSLAACDF